jgi:hypothetical protein
MAIASRVLHGARARVCVCVCVCVCKNWHDKGKQRVMKAHHCIVVGPSNQATHRAMHGHESVDMSCAGPAAASGK